MSQALFTRLANPTDDDYEYGLDVARAERDDLLEAGGPRPNDTRDGWVSPLPAWAAAEDAAPPSVAEAPPEATASSDAPDVPASHHDGIGDDNEALHGLPTDGFAGPAPTAAAPQRETVDVFDGFGGDTAAQHAGPGGGF
jgi:hypothetical protein